MLNKLKKNLINFQKEKKTHFPAIKWKLRAILKWKVVKLKLHNLENKEGNQ